MNVLPRQKQTRAQKAIVDPVTGKSFWHNNVDYYADQVLTADRDDILRQYRVTEGLMDDKAYNYVLNPLNTTVDRYKRFGSTLRNFDIIGPVINLYAGEFNQRFKNIQVLDSNPGDDNRYKEGLHSMIIEHYQAETVMNLAKLGLEIGDSPEEQQELQSKVEVYNRDFDSNRVITGQEILDYIAYDQDIDDKHQDGYIDWLKCGRVVTYKGVFHDDVDYESVPPWEYTSPKGGKGRMLEDDAWGVRRQVMGINDILDRWHDKMSEEDVEWLEARHQETGFHQSTGFVQLPSEWMSKSDDYNKKSSLAQVDGLEVFHVQWKSFKKMGIVKRQDTMGQIIEVDVQDDYVLNPKAGDLDLEWGWISTVCEGWRIGDDSNAIYIDLRELPYNRMSLNNKSEQKLSYNGRYNQTRTGKIISIASLGENYQVLYNIAHYQFEKLINKHKGSIKVIPIGLIPKGVEGWDEEKFMYYTHASDTMFIDETSPTAGIAINGMKVLSGSAGQEIREAIELLQSIKSEWWESIGMNRQRYGDSKASDGKAVTEQAIFRSAIISDELNRKFEKFQEKDYAGLLDISKLAYLNGKKAKYINSDSREAFLRVNPDDAVHHLESDYNIFVKNSRKENENIEMAREYGFSLGQNAEAEMMMELIGSSNFTKTKDIIKRIDKAAQQREQSAAQADRESNEAIADAQRQSEQADRELRKYEADKGYDKVLDSTMLKMNQEADVAEPADNAPDTETVRMNDHKINSDGKAHNLATQDLELKRKKVAADIAKGKMQKATAK